MKTLSLAVVAAGLLSACAAGRPDHYYILNAEPSGAAQARKSPATQVQLSITLPLLVDRSQMVLNTTAEGVTVLEHERWAAPLTDLVTQTLAQDIERRRSDLLVAGRGAVLASGYAIQMTVTVLQMTVRRNGKASIETHWRLLGVRTGKDEVGGEVFSAPLQQDDYAGVAHALSECVALLADRLVAELPKVE
ncbi:MAG: hypothetical protein NVS1B6_03550 [Steroidobacteraceae bacterium]